MRVLFALPGLHRYDRGAEIAFISIAKELANAGDSVTLMGSGQEQPGLPYRFLRTRSVRRENFRSWPAIPALRNDCAYEELTFVPDLLLQYRPSEYDVTLTCSYPFTNWILRRPILWGRRPPHVFVTQNGDWPAYSDQAEFRWFGCEGLVCTNPDFYERNRVRWRCELIPNGVDCVRFKPGPAQRELFGLPAEKLIVLMVSALIPTKRVEVAVTTVRQIPDAHLVVAGNGPLRQHLEAAAAKILPGRFTLLSVPQDQMPSLYRSATVFLHLAKDESFGNVFLEALACGLPVVAHDSIRTRWIVGQDQFLLDTDDQSAIAAEIKRAAGASTARKQSGVSVAKSFSWQRIGKMYRDFIQAVAAQGHHQAG
jgi:glycosyltransferase involved in cell wall biosynthesis